MIKGILFDLDGTIIDSELASHQAILECTRQWGLSVSKEEASIIVGQKWEVAFDLLFKNHRLPLSKDEASRVIILRYQEILRKDLPVVPGVVEAIRGLADTFRLALVSGSHREDIFWALRRLDVESHFECIFGAEDYAHSKPSPEGYLKALGTLGLSPSEAIVFEDSVAGLAAAEAAGLESVAITSTNHFGHDQGKARFSIHDFQGVNAEWVRTKFR